LNPKKKGSLPPAPPFYHDPDMYTRIMKMSSEVYNKEELRQQRENNEKT